MIILLLFVPPRFSFPPGRNETAGSSLRKTTRRILRVPLAKHQSPQPLPVVRAPPSPEPISFLKLARTRRSFRGDRCRAPRTPITGTHRSRLRSELRAHREDSGPPEALGPGRPAKPNEISGSYLCTPSPRRSCWCFFPFSP